tara:strand:- start:149445 stop:150236 length:792 start_codon:yes stop_codon:yes gene_type:complete
VRKNFENKLCWIVGASDGIGKAIALELSQLGANIILSSRNKEKLQDVKDKVSFGQVFIVPLDLADAKSVEQASVEVLKLGTPDFVFLIGGISQRDNFLETDLSTGRKIMETNFWGHVKVVEQVLPSMLELATSHIVEISSITGKFGYHRRSFYAASKHAVKGFFESLALEYHKHGLRVCVAYPGKIKTDISLRALKGNGDASNQKEEAHEDGMPVEKCAQIILNDVAKQKRESHPGGKEMLSLHLNRFLPKLLFKILLKKNQL